MNEVFREIESRMVGAVDAFQGELVTLRTGRASLAVVDGITVDYYGAQTPLNQVAALSVPDPTTITHDKPATAGRHHPRAAGSV